MNQFSEEIDDFLKKFHETFDLQNSHPDVQWDQRFEGLLRRKLIKDAYDKFVNRSVEEDSGKVKKILFVDNLGSSVNANAGTERYVSFENSDVYFDTKDSIDIEQKLKSITVGWKIPNDILPKDDRIRDLVKVSYTNASQYWVVNFLNVNVRKELAEYVLPKFREFERIDLQR